MLAGAHYRSHRRPRAGPRSCGRTSRRRWRWIDGPADPDGDGFIEYARQQPTGLVQQGWKDSDDSIFHADGTLAEGPIALCEIQGYVYAARLAAADLADALGLAERAGELRAQAEALRIRFEEAFWDEDLGTYGIALDGDKRLCRVPTSNPGHCLWTGIVSAERGRIDHGAAARRRDVLGLGHPHPGRRPGRATTRCPITTARSGRTTTRSRRWAWRATGTPMAPARVMHALFDASRHFDLARMPELFCGFTRRPGEGPTHYPVACAPQAWAAGAGLHAAPGLPRPRGRRARLHGPRHEPAAAGLPDHLQLENVAVGDARLDLRLQRQRDGVGTMRHPRAPRLGRRRQREVTAQVGRPARRGRGTGAPTSRCSSCPRAHPVHDDHRGRARDRAGGRQRPPRH